MLEVRGITKTYGGVTALREASFRVRPGTVHALLGENGACKLTLVKIIAGAVRQDSGVLELDGVPVSFSSTAEAARSGVAVVSQELALFPDLDVLINLFSTGPLRRGPLLSRAAMAARAAPVLKELGLEVDPGRLLGTLPLADRQRIEIGRALLTDPRILVLDEPTSALESAGSENLLNIIKVLRDRGVGVVFVSHILEEVLSLSDEVTVLRDGSVVMAAADRASLTIPLVVAAMLGGSASLGGRPPAPLSGGTTPGSARPPSALQAGRGAAARARPGKPSEPGSEQAVLLLPRACAPRETSPSSM